MPIYRFSPQRGADGTGLGKDAVVAFLEYLAVQRNVAASTQNQALNALVFLYKQVLDQPLDELGDFARAKRPKRLPVVLSQAEARALVESLTGATPALYPQVGWMRRDSTLCLLAP